MSMQKSESQSSWLTYPDAIAAQWHDLLLLLARVLLGWIFVMSGWGKLMNISGFAATMPRRGLPEFLGYIAPFVEFIGGVLLIVGLATRYASLFILLFIIIATFSFVPTPSVLDTSTGSVMPSKLQANMPPKLPMSDSTPGV